MQHSERLAKLLVKEMCSNSLTSSEVKDYLHMLATAMRPLTKLRSAGNYVVGFSPMT